MKQRFTSLFIDFHQRILMCTLALLLPMMAQASHGTTPVSDIDYTGMGTYSGSYTHSSTDHVWVIFNANAGNVITITMNTGFTHHFWLYRSNTGCVQVGNAAPTCLTLVSDQGNGATVGTYSYTVTSTGQFAFQLDSYLGASGSYNMTISGSTATTTLCSPTAPTFTTCPSNLTSNTTSGCAATVSYTATASSGTITYSKTGATTASGSGTGSGTSFNKGTTNVTLTSTNACGGTTGTCSFTVTVNDVQNPTITAPANITITANTGQCSRTGVALGSPTVSDNCTGTTFSNNGLSTYPKGTTTVTWTATDASGNTATATQTVTVTDNQNPTITAPSAVSVNANAGLCYATGVSLGSATFADNCTGVTSSNNAPSQFPVGTTTVLWTATDASGNTATATQSVTVTDNQNPTITAPAAVSVNADAGLCSASGVTLGSATAADNCSVAVSNNAPSTFAVGTTTVTWTATDAVGNTASATQTVTVTDNQNPAISGLTNAAVSADAGACTANVSLATSSSSASCLTGWTHTVPVQISSANTSTLTNYQVKVVVNTQALIAAGQMQADGDDIRFNDGSCTPLSYWIESGMNTTNTVIWVKVPSVPVGSSTITMNHGNVSATAASSGTNTFINFDDFEDGNTAGWTFGSGTWNVSNISGNNVMDVTNPGFSDGAEAVLATSLGANYIVETDYFPVYDWSYGGPLFQYNDLSNYYAVHSMPDADVVMQSLITGGSPDYNMMWSAPHNSGQWFNFRSEQSNTGSNIYFNNSFVATVPLVFGSGAGLWSYSDQVYFDNFRVREFADVVPTTTVGSGGGFSVTDNCGISSVINDYNNTGDASGTYPIGTTTVTWTATDVNGNSSTSTQTVTVTDNENPTITAPADVTVSADAGQCSAATPALGTPTYGDNCSGSTVGSDATSPFAIGTTTVTWTVTDASGNTATATQTVTVTDNEDPTIVNLPANISVGNDAGVCGATVSWTAPTSADNCTGHSIAQTAGQASGSVFALGTSTITYTTTDASGNDVSGSFTVTVTDNEDPTIVNLPASISVNNDANVCGATVSWTEPTSADNCSGHGIAQTSGQANGSVFPVGTSTVTYTATDAAGNDFASSFTITVTDNEDPTIVSLPANVSVNNDAGVCGATVNWTAPTSADNCTGHSIAQTAGQSNGSVFPVGTSTVTYTATDAVGNDVSSSFTVTVTDNEDPTIVNLSANISVSNDAGVCGATVNWTAPTSADNCTGHNIAQTAGLASGSVFPIGTSTVTYTATDAAGNDFSASFTVTVTDNEDPTIVNLPASVSVNNDANVCGATVSWTAPTSADNCTGHGIAQTAGLASGSIFPIGTSTVTYTATDAAGNDVSASFTVTVTDNQNPTITAPGNVTVNNYCEDAPADLGSATASDNCAYVVTNNAPALFPVGTTTVTWTVTDASNNTATATQTVTVNPVTLSISGTTTNVSCNGGNNGAIDITVNNGTSPYAYNWSNGATTQDISGLSAGSYTVNVTDDHSCTGSASYTISQPTALTCNTSVSPNPTVAGQQQYTIFRGYGPQSVTITASASGGTSPYTYSWSNGATTASTTVSPIVTTTYTVTITDAHGCITTCTRTIYVKDVRDGNKIFVCHIPPGNPGNANTLSVSSSAVAAHLAHGDYLGTCVNAKMIGNGETEEVAEALHFHVYPNPTTGTFTIELPQTGNTDVVVTDITGKVIERRSLKGNMETQLQFNLGDAAKGIYLIKVINADKVYQSKITLQ